MNPSTSLILAHFGGIRKLRRLFDIAFFISFQNGVRFHFSGSQKYNAVSIEIVSLKIYNMKFYTVVREGKKFTQFNENFFFGLSSDELIAVFEQETGLFLTL